jgi:guanosine-3',5'-bis(diphosphate) 3'-pyrophosphohydrolase
MADLGILTATANFAAKKHRDHRRKDKEASPYINHPIGTAFLATSVGGITDLKVLQAALLHDTVEDADTTHEELVTTFGQEVAGIVAEVTDDKSLGKVERKRKQIEHVPHISNEGKLVKLCDKLYNLTDLVSNPPEGYTVERIQGYCIWSRMVIAGARGLNQPLEDALDAIFNGHFVFEGLSYPCCPAVLDERHIFPPK